MTSPFFQMPLNLADNMNLASAPMQGQPQGGPAASPTASSPGIGAPNSFPVRVQPQPQRPIGGSGGGNKKGTSAERRATHNAIERARRESLNGRFLQLAATLPAISDVRRPSKSLIVNKSLDFVHESLSREAMYRSKIGSLRGENDQLRDQLNEFRRQAGLDLLSSPAADELPKPLAEMGGDKKRSNSMSGSFNNGLGDLGELDEDDGLHAASSEGETSRTSPVSASAVMAGSSANSLARSGSMPSSMPDFRTLQSAPTFQATKAGEMPGGMPQSRAPSNASTHSSDVTQGDRPVMPQGAWNLAFSSASLGGGMPSSFSFGDFAFNAASGLVSGVSGAAGNQTPSSGFSHYTGNQSPAGAFTSTSSAGAMAAANPLSQSPHPAGLDSYSSLGQPQGMYAQQYVSTSPFEQVGQASAAGGPALQQVGNHSHFAAHHYLQQQQTQAHQQHFFESSPLQTSFMAAV